MTLVDRVKRVLLVPKGTSFHSMILRTGKISIADFNDDRVVDANDYAVVLRDLGKVGNSMGDMASMKDGRLVIGIPDGKVDETDVAAFEQELARYEALREAVYGAQAAAGETPLRIHRELMNEVLAGYAMHTASSLSCACFSRGNDA